MEGVRTFLESSTIHGLAYIATSGKYVRLLWIIIVFAGFTCAGFLIYASFNDWSENPIKTTVDTRPIYEITFPKVTVCPPNSGKWISLVEALNNFDKDCLIFDVMKQHNKDHNSIITRFFLQSFLGSKNPKKEIIMKEFDPKLTLDHDLPNRLNLLPEEEESFYLIHYACYSLGDLCKSAIKDSYSDIKTKSFYSVLEGKTRQQTANTIREIICQIENVNCSTLNETFWINCNDTNTKNDLMYQNWCNKCFNLSDCLQLQSGVTDDMFVEEIVMIFHSWRKYVTKKDLIYWLMVHILDEDYSEYFDFDDYMSHLFLILQ